MSSRPSGSPTQFDTSLTNAAAPSGGEVTSGKAAATPLESSLINWMWNQQGIWLKYFADGDVRLSDVSLLGLTLASTPTSAAITNATQNDFDGVGGTYFGQSVLRLTGGGVSARITGFAVNDATEGRMMWVINHTGNPFNIGIESVSSINTNRIDFGPAASASDVIVPSGSAFLMRYTGTGTAGRCEIISCNFVPGTSFQMQPGANITFSGTGHALHGDRVITVPCNRFTSVNVAGGGATTPSVVTLGAGVPASSTNAFMVHPSTTDNRLMAITSATVYVAVTGGTATFKLQQSTSAGNLTDITGASNSTSSASHYTALVLTPSAPYVMATDALAGGTVWVTIVAGSGITVCDILSIDFHVSVLS